MLQECDIQGACALADFYVATLITEHSLFHNKSDHCGQVPSSEVLRDGTPEQTTSTSCAHSAIYLVLNLSEVFDCVDVPLALVQIPGKDIGGKGCKRAVLWLKPITASQKGCDGPPGPM